MTIAYSSFIFSFQDHLGVEINDDSNFHPMLQNGILRGARGHGSEKSYLGQVPYPYLGILEKNYGRYCQQKSKSPNHKRFSSKKLK